MTLSSCPCMWWAGVFSKDAHHINNSRWHFNKLFSGSFHLFSWFHQPCVCWWHSDLFLQQFFVLLDWCHQLHRTSFREWWCWTFAGVPRTVKDLSVIWQLQNNLHREFKKTICSFRNILSVHTSPIPELDRDPDETPSWPWRVGPWNPT